MDSIRGILKDRGITTNLHADITKISAFSLLLLLYYTFSATWKYFKRLSFKKAAGCKEPPRLPFSGFLGIKGLRKFIDHAKRNALQDFFITNFETYGDTVKFKMFGVGEPVITREPENIKTILATSFEDFDLGYRKPHFEPVFGSGIFNSDGQMWKDARALLRPQFVKKSIANLEKIERHFLNFITRISTEIEEGNLHNGGRVNLQPILARLAMDSSTDFLLGYSTNALLQKPEDIANKTEMPKEYGPYQYGFMEGFDRTIAGCGKALRLGMFNKIIHWNHDFIYATKIVHTFFNHQIDIGIARKKAEGKARPGDAGDNYDNFLSALLSTTEDRKIIRDQLTNILLAGRDTTSSVLGITFFTLAKHPEIYTKLRSEILATFGRDITKFSYSSLKDCTYLQWIINEVLRLYPPVPQNRRQAVRDATIPTGGGPDGKSPIFIKKGEAVMFVSYALHRRKDLYGDDAEEFVPERWDSTKRKQPPSWAYIPFNGGPRICIGQQYALTEMGYVIARMCQIFERIEPFVGEENAEFIPNTSGLTMCNLHGCRVRLWRDEDTKITN